MTNIAKNEIKNIIEAVNNGLPTTGCQGIVKMIFEDYNKIDTFIAEVLYEAYNLGLKDDKNLATVEKRTFNLRKKDLFFSFVSKVEKYYNINIMRKSRKDNLQMYRFAIYHLTRNLYQRVEIAALMQQHHTTIIHALIKSEDYIFTKDPLFMPILEEITLIFNQIYKNEK